MRDQAQDLIKNRGDHCREVIEPTLTELNQRFEALSRRIKTGKVGATACHADQVGSVAHLRLLEYEVAVRIFYSSQFLQLHIQALHSDHGFMTAHAGYLLEAHKGFPVNPLHGTRCSLQLLAMP